MALPSRRALLGIPDSAGFVRVAAAQRINPRLVTYTTFVGKPIQVRAYLGRNIALLLNPGRVTDGELAYNVVDALDAGWDWYRDMFGRAPTPVSTGTVEGRSTIAENAQDPAAYARGRVGQTGIEMGPSTMSRLLIEAAQDRYNQAIFYEFGRNFWFFDAQLGAIPAPVVGGVFTTGFATVNRFYAMEAKGLAGAPWDDAIDFDRFRYLSLIDTVDRYLADPKLNWQNTVAVNRAAAPPHDWIEGYHLAAGFFHRIRRDHGFAGYRRFWQLMAKAPKAATPRDVVINFVRIAHAATGQDYRELMRDRSLPL